MYKITFFVSLFNHYMYIGYMDFFDEMMNLISKAKNITQIIIIIDDGSSLPNLNFTPISSNKNISYLELKNFRLNNNDDYNVYCNICKFIEENKSFNRIKINGNYI